MNINTSKQTFYGVRQQKYVKFSPEQEKIIADIQSKINSPNTVNKKGETVNMQLEKKGIDVYIEPSIDNSVYVMLTKQNEEHISNSSIVKTVGNYNKNSCFIANDLINILNSSCEKLKTILAAILAAGSIFLIGNLSNTSSSTQEKASNIVKDSITNCIKLVKK